MERAEMNGLTTFWKAKMPLIKSTGDYIRNRIQDVCPNCLFLFLPYNKISMGLDGLH